MEAFLQGYKGRGTVVQVKIVGNSSSIWTISPPSRDLMTKYLSDNNVTMRFSYEFTRWESHSTVLCFSISVFTSISLISCNYCIHIFFTMPSHCTLRFSTAAAPPPLSLPYSLSFSFTHPFQSILSMTTNSFPSPHFVSLVQFFFLFANL